MGREKTTKIETCTVGNNYIKQLVDILFIYVCIRYVPPTPLLDDTYIRIMMVTACKVYYIRHKTCTHIYTHDVYIYVYVHIYIYIYIRCVQYECIYMYMHVYIYIILCIYIYIYGCRMYIMHAEPHKYQTHNSMY